MLNTYDPEEEFHRTSGLHEFTSPSKRLQGSSFTHTSQPRPVSAWGTATSLDSVKFDHDPENAIRAIQRRYIRAHEAGRAAFIVPDSTLDELTLTQSKAEEELYKTSNILLDISTEIKRIAETSTGRPPSPQRQSRGKSPEQVRAEAKEAPVPSQYDDPVSFFAKNKNGPIKFVYLNQMKNIPNPNPYNLQVVPYSEIDKDYYTMSANGITYIRSDGHSEFTPMPVWVREAEVFHIITRLDVFKNYRYWKSFRKWRKYITQRRLKANRTRLEQSLFLLKPIFSKYLLQVLKMLEADLSRRELLPIRPHANYSVAEFNNNLGNGPNSHKRAVKLAITEFVDQVIEQIERLVAEVIDPERMKLPESDFQTKARRKVSLRQLMLIEKQKALEQTRITEMVNREIELLGNFIRCADYLIIENLAKLVISDFQTFRNTLQGEKSTVFATQVTFDSSARIVFNPDVDTVKALVQDVLKEMVQQLNNVTRVLYHGPFDKYLVQSDQKPQSVSEAPTLIKSLNEINEFTKVQQDIVDIIDSSFNSAAKYAAQFSEHKTVFQFGQTWNVQAYKESNPTLEQLTSDLARFTKWSSDLERIQTSSTRGLLYIDSKALKATLVPIPARAIEDLKALVIAMAYEKTTSLIEFFRTSISALAAEPSTLEEFVKFLELYNPTSHKTTQCSEEIGLIDEMYQLLEDHQAQIPPEHSQQHMLTNTVFTRFKDSLSIGQATIQKLKPGYVKVLESSISAASKTFESLNTLLQADAFADSESFTTSLLMDLAEIRSQMQELKTKIDKYAEYQRVMDIPVSGAVEDIRRCLQQLDRTEELWQTMAKWQALEEVYSSTQFVQLKKEDIESELMAVYTKASELAALTPDNPVAKTIVERVSQYQNILPLILMLANPAIKPRHWARLFQAVGRPYDDDTQFTLADLRSYSILSHVDIITEISTLASGEYHLETSLQTIEQTWQDAALPLVEYVSNKSKNIVILSETAVDDIISRLEEHEVILTTLLNSEYVSGIRDKVTSMKTRVCEVWEVLEEWLNCQQRWLQLDPIFSEYEVQRALASSTTKFRVLDRKWKAIMRNAQSEPKLMVATAQPGLLMSLGDCRSGMEIISQSLDGYLDSKRMMFPRLFFLSSTEMCKAIGCNQNPQLVQTLLPKLFNDLKSLDFSADGTAITGCTGLSGETLVFMQPVPVENGVETWLLAVHRQMRRTLRMSMVQAYADYSRKPLENWIFDWPVQIITTVLQVVWNRNIDAALESNTDELSKVEASIVVQQQSIQPLLNRPFITPLQRQQLVAVLSTSCYMLDIVRRMIAARVDSVHHVEVARHLRFCWDDKKDKAYVRQMGSTLKYGYEFVGSITRSIITPATERCFLGLTEALANSPGAFVTSPETSDVESDFASGKSTSVKELAKLLGRYTVSFHSADTFNLRVMSKLLLGAVQSGAWAVFNGFSKAEPGTLSVLAQHLRMVADSISEKSDKVTIDGSSYALKPKFALILTGTASAESAELPSNLRQTLRPVAMASPDLDVIAEVTLFSEGFRNPRVLARKLVYVYNTMSTKLFLGEHFDLGLRSFRDALHVAIRLKNRPDPPSADDTNLLLRAVYDSNIAKFSPSDARLFTEFLKDQFGDQVAALLEEKKTSTLRSQLSSFLSAQARPFSAASVDKTAHLRFTLQSHRGVIVVGPAGSGKTSIIRNLAAFLPAGTDSTISSVKTSVVNPAMFSVAELFGYFSPTSGDWVDGLVSRLVRKPVATDADGKTREHWVVLDGKVHPAAAAYFNTVLDDTSLLSLANGEHLGLPAGLKFIFEVEDLDQLPQSIINHCGIVRVEATDMTWRDYLPLWSSGAFKMLSEDYRAHLFSFFDNHLAEALQFVRENCKEGLQLNDKHLVKNLCNLIDSVLPVAVPRPHDTFNLLPQLNFLFLFSLAWALGGHLLEEDRARFDRWIHEHFKMILGAVGDDSVYNYCFAEEDPESGEQPSGGITTWDKLVAPVTVSAQSESTVVPTIDAVRFSFLFNALLSKGHHVVLVGSPSSNKSTVVNRVSANSLFQTVSKSLSTDTNAAAVEDLIESQFFASRKNVLGPPIGRKIMLALHNLNVDAYPPADNQLAPSQEVAELVRHVLNNGGFSDPRTLEYVKVRDFQVLATVSSDPAFLQRNPSLARMLSQFSVFYLPPPSDATLRTILTPIVQGIVTQFSAELADQLTAPLTEASIAIYRATSEHFKHEKRPHYVFSLNSLMKVFRGLKQIKVPEGNIDAHYMLLVRAWRHEMSRAIGDFLATDEDRGWFEDLADIQLANKFELREAVPRQIFFADPTADGSTGNYSETTMEQLTAAAVAARNASESPALRDVVLHESFLRNLFKTVRVVNQASCSALIAGPHESGRSTLVRLACLINGCELTECTVSPSYGPNEFAVDLRRTLLRAGVEDKKTAVLVTAQHLATSALVERIEEVIRTGFCPALFSEDDRDRIYAQIRESPAYEGQPQEDEFVQRRLVENVRRNFHFFLAVDPATLLFTKLIRTFPSLLNLATVIWINPWGPADFTAVAATLLRESAVDELAQTSDAIASASVRMYQAVEPVDEAGPSSPLKFVEFVRTFIAAYREKAPEYRAKIEALQGATQRFQAVSTVIATIKVEREGLKPELQKVTDDTKKLEEQIAKHSKTVADFLKAVAAEQANVGTRSGEQHALADEVRALQAEFDKVMPSVHGATAGVRSINANDIVELLSYLPNPPERIQKIFEAICVVKGAPVSLSEANVILSDSLQWMLTYDKEHVPEEILNKLKKYIINPEFKPQGLLLPSGQESKAAKFLCQWIIAVYNYALAYKALQPKKEKLSEVDAHLVDAQRQLLEKQGQLTIAEARLNDFKNQFKTINEAKIVKEKKGTDLALRLTRHDKLVEALGSKEQQWAASIAQLERSLATVVGNTLVYAASIAFFGPHDAPIRARLRAAWQEILAPESPTAAAENVSAELVMNQAQVREWLRQGLPADAHSKENALSVARNARWPFIIDPERKASPWIKSLEKGSKLQTVFSHTSNFMQLLEQALIAGRPLLFEMSVPSLTAELRELLVAHNFYRRPASDSTTLLFNGKEVRVSDGFRLYIVCPYHRPQFLDVELRQRVNVIDFSLRKAVVDEQLLSVIVGHERPDVQQQKQQAAERLLADRKQQQDLEDKLVEVVNSIGDNNLLDDEAVVNELVSIRSTLNGLEKSVTSAVELDTKCADISEPYAAVAARGGLFYELLRDLSVLDPMYQHGLAQFVTLFKNTLSKTTQNPKLNVRINTLLRELNYTLFTTVRDSLNERHRLLFAFLMAVRIQRQQRAISDAEYALLVQPEAVAPVPPADEKPDEPWLTKRVWDAVLRLETVLPGITRSIVTHGNDWKAFVEADKPFQARKLPAEWDEKVNPFQRILLVRAVLSSKHLLEEVSDFVRKQLGETFLELGVIEIEKIYPSTSATTPVVFVLQEQGLDPATLVTRFAFAQGMRDKLRLVSLGREQSDKSLHELLHAAMTDGHWLLLQNAHLVPSWLPALESVLSAGDVDPPNSAFRLWITSKSTVQFPLSILQRSIKVWSGFPATIRGSMMALYKNSDHVTISSCRKPAEFKKLVFGLNVLHSMLWTRRRFGTLGWAGAIGVNNVDHSIALERIKQYLNASEDRSEDVPYESLQFLLSEVLYGQQISEPRDLEVFKTILQDFVSPAIMEDRFSFSSKEGYNHPAEGSVAIDTYLNALPVSDTPDIVGISDNVQVAVNRRDAVELLAATSAVESARGGALGSGPPSSSAAGRDRLAALVDEVDGILEDELELRSASREHLSGYLGNVLSQEVHALNKTLRAVRQSLTLLRQAAGGDAVLLARLDQLSRALLDGLVPAEWRRQYPSQLPLRPWLLDLAERVSFFRLWLASGPPSVFSIGLFAYPQALLSYVVQRYARKANVSADTVTLEFDLAPLVTHTDAGYAAPPHDDGIYVEGLWLEGARWENNQLEELSSSQLHYRMPPLLCYPVGPGGKPSPLLAPPALAIALPVYSTSSRKQVHQLASIRLPSPIAEPVWLKRGAVLLTHLDSEFDSRRFS